MNIFKKLAVFLFITGNFYAAFAQKQAMPKLLSPDSTANKHLSYKIIGAANGTWCYDILADGILRIHQPSIPGMGGTNGFKTKGDAEKVAKLVIDKIRKGGEPPSVTKEEMKKLGVL